MRWTKDRMDKLYAHADAILDRKANGHAFPILEALSVKGHGPARNALATILTDPLPQTQFKGGADVLRGLAIMRTDIRRGDPTTLYNLAIHYRNLNNLRQYRYWLARAVRKYPDPDDIRQLKAFDTRFPHGIMRRYGRIRPYLKRDG